MTPGRLVTISGANFGSKWRRGSSVKFGSKKAIVSSWGANEIKCKVPLRTGWGAMLVTVTTLRGTSNGVSFTVEHRRSVARSTVVGGAEMDFRDTGVMHRIQGGGHACT